MAEQREPMFMLNFLTYKHLNILIFSGKNTKIQQTNKQTNKQSLRLDYPCMVTGHWNRELA